MYLELLKRVDNNETCDWRCGTRRPRYVRTSVNIEQEWHAVLTTCHTVIKVVVKSCQAHDSYGRQTPDVTSYVKSCTNEQFLTLLNITGYRTGNSSGDEIANVNFRNDDIVHALQNAILSCMNSTTDRRGYVLEHRFTKFNEITQCNSHYAVQCHWSPILVPIESSYTTSY